MRPMSRTTRPVDRRAFTLMEMLIALTIMAVVMSVAVPFFRVQLRSVTAHAGRMDAQQNVRFAVTAIDRDLRMAGVGIVDKQPMVVQADPYAVTFNADLVTHDSTDPGAVYYDADADSSTTT